MTKFKIAPQNGLIICHARIAGKGKPIFLKMAPESPVEGLLGLDFFIGTRIILDLHRNTLEIIE